MDYPISVPAVGLADGKFSDGNPSEGIPASLDRAADMNAVYDELINVIVGAGIAPDEDDKTQLLAAIQALAGISQSNADDRYRRKGAMLVRDEKSEGTQGGNASANTLITRTLNTVVFNTIDGASLNANKITLPAGTYRVRGSSPAHRVNKFRASLYNVTDNTIVAAGTSENANDPAGSDPAQVRSYIVGRFTITAPKEFSIKMWTEKAQATYGLGREATAGMGNEIFTYLEIEED